MPLRNDNLDPSVPELLTGSAFLTRTAIQDHLVRRPRFQSRQPQTEAVIARCKPEAEANRLLPIRAREDGGRPVAASIARWRRRHPIQVAHLDRASELLVESDVMTSTILPTLIHGEEIGAESEVTEHADAELEVVVGTRPLWTSERRRFGRMFT